MIMKAVVEWTAFEGYLRSQGFHIHRDRQRAAVKDLYPEVAHYPLPELTLWSQWFFFYPFFFASFCTRSC